MQLIGRIILEALLVMSTLLIFFLDYSGETSIDHKYRRNRKLLLFLIPVLGIGSIIFTVCDYYSGKEKEAAYQRNQDSLKRYYKYQMKKTELNRVAITGVKDKTDSIFDKVGASTDSMINQLKLKFDSTGIAIENLGSASKIASKQIQASVDKVERNANILKNDLVSEQIILGIRYTVKNLGPLGYLPFNYAETFANSFKYGLNIHAKEVKANYKWEAGKFEPVVTAYDKVRNGYWKNWSEGYPNRYPSTMFIIYYEFNLEGLIEGRLNDLAEGDTFTFQIVDSYAFQRNVPSGGNKDSTEIKIFDIEPVGGSIKSKEIAREIEFIKDSGNPFSGNPNVSIWTYQFRIVE